MAKKISSLSVILGATTAPFEKAFRGAGNAVSSLQSKLASAGKSILKFTGIAGGLGAVLSGAGISVGIKRQLDAVDAAAKFADRIGISTEALSGLQHAAELTGVQANQLNMGLQRMTRRVATAAKGSGEAVKALAELGLSAQALAAMSPDEQFRRIADAMEGVENQSDRVRLSFALFDSEGVGLVNTMRGGSAAIDELVGEAGRLGLTFNRMDAAKIEQANDAITRMRAVGTGVFRSLAVAAAPFLTSAVDRITAFGERASEAIRRFVSVIVSRLQAAWAAIMANMDILKGLGVAVATAAGAYVAWRAALIASAVAMRAAAATGLVWRTVLAGIELATRTVMIAQAALRGSLLLVIAATKASWAAMVATKTAMFAAAAATRSLTVAKAAGLVVTKAVTAAQWLLNAALTANPIGLVVVAIGGLVAWLGTAAAKIIDLGAVVAWFNRAWAIASYAVTNWQDTLKLALVGAVYGIVRFANQVVHVIGTVIPDFLMWLGRNWRQVFTDILNGTALILVHLYDNITGFFKSVWSWLKGDGFDWQWTGLTEGFESTLEELPKIAERQIGPLEKSLGDQAARLGKSWSEGLAAHLAGHDKAVEEATGTIADIGSAIEIPEIEAITAPDSPIQAITDGIEGIGAAAKTTSDQLQALFSGSAESQRARFAARLNAGQGSTAAAAAPVPAAATRAMRENAGNDNLMKQLVELIRTGTNRTLEDIRDVVRDGGLAVAGDI